MAYVSRFMTSPVSDYRAALEKQWQENEDDILKVLKSQINRDYYNKIISMVDNRDLSSSIQGMVLFFEQLGTCVNLNICDRDAVTLLLAKQGQLFFRQYYPYICRLRSKWGDPSIGHELEVFFNPISVGKACAT